MTMKTRIKGRCFSYLLILIIGLSSYVGLWEVQLYLENEELNDVRRYNYFAEFEERLKLGYILNTTNCWILNISPWDKSLIPDISDARVPEDCRAQKGQKQWTYVQGENLILNVTNVTESGYKMETIDCCYRTITRVEQSMLKYDSKADKKIKLSEDCRPIHNQTTKSTNEFIRVICTVNVNTVPYFVYYTTVLLYKQYHAFALPFKNKSTKRKIDYWSKIYKSTTATSGSSSKFNNVEQVPPNVLIIGIDSLSRLSFRRNMKQTKKVLEDIGAVEFFGYTKVGEGTFQNSAVFLSGYSEEELVKICYFSSETSLDSCPFIWKDFSRANYFTALVEDAPYLGMFNLGKSGFVTQPVDFYFRPFMLAATDLEPKRVNSYEYLDCIVHQTVDEVLLQYISNLAEMSKTMRTPIFLSSWLTNLAHDDINGPKFADATYANFIRNLDLTNTVLFFISDHGYRYGHIRSTPAGWYEDKLPNFWAYLPTSLKLKFPNWDKSLHVNSNRLTSPFDLYKTIQHLLETFTPVRTGLSSRAEDGVELPQRYGQSIFTDVPFERRCEDAGIRKSLCACVVAKMLPSNSSELRLAAEAAVSHINNFIPNVCSNLSISSITGGATLDQDDGSPDSSNGTRMKKERRYVVDFVTMPGDFLFEATVTAFFNRTLETPLLIVDPDILRMTKISTDVSCAKAGVIQRFCYCAFLEKM